MGVLIRAWCACALLIVGVLSNPVKRATILEDDTADHLPLDKYTTHNKMTEWLKGLEKRHPSLVRLHSVGKSVRKRDLWAVELGRAVAEGERPLGMPMVKLVANMHGNEAVGRELLLQLTSLLVRGYSENNMITRLLNTTDLFIMPSMNPDGFAKAKEGDCWGGDESSGRLNAQNVDLNRNFPDQFVTEDQLLRTAQDLQKGRAPETRAMIRWILNNPFVLSANLHGGAMVISYPFDSSKSHVLSGVESRSPDDSFFKLISRDYAQRHKAMQKEGTCGEFYKGGITNGAYWYDVPGGMQDFNYVHSDCFEITMELSCCKYPPANELPEEWDNNRMALLSFVNDVHRGVKGLVNDTTTGKPIEKAVIVVDGIDKNITTTARGEYWRLLVPGQYKIKAVAQGYQSTEWLDVTVTEHHTESLNFSLTALDETDITEETSLETESVPVTDDPVDVTDDPVEE